jgi:glycerophosphoryl diester phosphodiesterase
MLRIGHRGAAGHAPENTLASIEKGIALGADFVELDLQRTADGHLVVMHDKRVDRTTNGSGYVSQMRLDEIRKLDAGNGQQVPTLEEVFRLAQGRVGLMLEIIAEGIAGEVVAAARRSRFDGPVIYASFLHAEVLDVRKAHDSAVTLALLEGVPISPTTFATEANVSHVGISMESATPAFLTALQQSRFTIFVYTVNDPRDIKWLESLGVDGLISDFPERILKSH